MLKLPITWTNYSFGPGCVDQWRTWKYNAIVVWKTIKKARAPRKQNMLGVPHEWVSLDLMGPINTSDLGNRYIVVISDHFTKWIAGFALPDITAETVARALVEEWVCRYGPTKFLHSDQGRQYEAEVFQAMCTLLGLTRGEMIHYCSSASVIFGWRFVSRYAPQNYDMVWYSSHKRYN